ncbi:MAG: aminomethyl-transferring glycine dehydrogenase subunit GcvPA [bacterium]|nr:aminomethyl-transferring glycine dehydrogenase subunit GcvPA [bacterium]
MTYIPHTDADRERMLRAIGVRSMEDLFSEIPAELRFEGRLNLPQGMDEITLRAHLQRLAAQNLDSSRCVCFLGGGIYDHFAPAVVDTILSRGEFLTAYTPYQPEVSQGILQAMFEYQTMICQLTGMEVSNASMYDGATALAEAALMAWHHTGRRRIAISQSVHPHYRHVVRTYADAAGLQVVEIPCSEQGFTALDAPIDEDVACVLWQHPNFYGNLEPMAELTARAHEHGALAIVAVDPIALGILKPPGEYGVDVVVGEGQPLGLAMGYGGPLLGFYACKEEYVRRLPGRIIGETVDIEGRRGFVMTLRTREQDIRRERATSNICTNEALMALAAAVYLSALGKQGMQRVANLCLQKAHYLAMRLTELPGVQMVYPQARFFKEFVVSLPCPAEEVVQALLPEYLAGLPLSRYEPGREHHLLIAVTEKRTRQEMDDFVRAVQRALREA